MTQSVRPRAHTLQTEPSEIIETEEGNQDNINDKRFQNQPQEKAQSRGGFESAGRSTTLNPNRNSPAASRSKSTTVLASTPGAESRLERSSNFSEASIDCDSLANQNEQDQDFTDFNLYVVGSISQSQK